MYTEIAKTPQPPEIIEHPKEQKDLVPNTEMENDHGSVEHNPSPYKDESDKELSPLKDIANVVKNKEILSENKDDCSPADHSKLDKDSVIGDEVLSDLESEGTQPEEVCIQLMFIFLF